MTIYLYRALLIELGDQPARQSTCPEAVCWDRTATTAWLAEGKTQCQNAKVQPPATVDHYLELFEAWDVADQLRRRHRQTIELLRESSVGHPEWHLIEEWLVTNEIPFYEEALRNPVLKCVLEEYGFEEPKMRRRMKSESDILKLTKPTWTLYPCGPDKEGINIHFECAGRGYLRLDVEVFPYEGTIANKPDRLVALREQLKLRAKLHRLIRPGLAALSERTAAFLVVQKGLSRPDVPSANSAGRFDGGLTDNCSPEQHAAFMAGVIDAVTPIIDRLLRGIIC